MQLVRVVNFIRNLILDLLIVYSTVVEMLMAHPA